MSILLDPNVAYLILVSGFLLATLAIFSPGTGVLEISALFAIVLAGYTVANLPFNWWALVILLIGVFPFIIAVRQSQRTIYLVVSIIALVIGSVFLFRSPNGGPAVNLVLAVVVSVLTSGFLWMAASKILKALAMKPSQNLSKLIGEIGETKTTISREGTVYVGGENWSARSNVVIPPNTRVRVLSRDGFILEVEPLETVVQQ
jgi:membrane-bound ClpP family serine protease